MRAPLPWLAEYVTLSASTTAADVAADLVRVGLEEEAIHGGDVRGPVVVGRVVTFEPEPQRNGKTIRWCQVDVGEAQPRGIVCGAANFDVGDLVVVSLPGAVLAGGFAITARRTYGHTSDGMICSARELGIGEDHDGIIVLAGIGHGDVAVGSDAIRLLGLDEETVEVNVTPDRGYAFSIRGIAREYGHATGATFTDPAPRDTPPPTADGFAVEIDDAAGCDRFVARVVRGVRSDAGSPPWLRRRLEQAGMRPISMPVDVTNYVMLALGQPLHAYDLATLTAPIVVRPALEGATLVTLDGVTRSLHAEDLLITDSRGGRGARPLGLAGVMGGADSEVSATTTDLLVEAAHFDPVSIARTSRRHGLSSEASRRFERGVDTDLAHRAAQLAVDLLIEFGGGTAGQVTDTDRRQEVPAIRMPADLPARVVGLPYTPAEVQETLTAIGCDVAGAGADLVVTAPSWRPDLRLGVDLVEEVARLRGYDRIPSVLPIAPPGGGLTGPQRARRSVARALAERGLVEVLSYPFVSPGIHDVFGLSSDDPRRQALTVANPISAEQPQLRTSLLPPLLDTLRRNVARGLLDVGLFEVGLVFRPDGGDAAARVLPATGRPSEAELADLDKALPSQPRRVAVVLTGQHVPASWSMPARPADWADAVSMAQVVARTVGAELEVSQDEHPPWHPGRCARLVLAGTQELVGHAGELDPRVLARLGLPPRIVAAELDLDRVVAAAPGELSARPISTFPVAKEDVALVVDEPVPAATVTAALREGAGDLLESVRLFDVYTGDQVGPGRKSLAFSLRFRAPDRTLKAAEIASVRDAAVASASSRTGAVLRTA